MLEVAMFLTRWLCIAEQQVHIWTQEAVGSGCRARRWRALSHCQSFSVQSLEVHFVGQLCSQNTNICKTKKQERSSLMLCHQTFYLLKSDIHYCQKDPASLWTNEKTLSTALMVWQFSPVPPLKNLSSVLLVAKMLLQIFLSLARSSLLSPLGFSNSTTPSKEQTIGHDY